MDKEVQISTREKFFPSLYHRHGSRRIDYIIVYSTKEVLKSDKSKNNMSLFMENIVAAGGILEISYLSSDEDVAFIKVHFPYKILEAYAKTNGIDLACKSPQLPDTETPSKLKCRRTPLSDRENSSIYYRAKDSISGKNPKLITQAERILLVHCILQEIKWGANSLEYGLERLQKSGLVIDSFPLHEGPATLNEIGPLTDRQLLAGYWGDIKNFFKEQPVQLIEKYFGPELAFYFAFIIFCNKMLLIACVISTLFFVVGLVITWNDMAVIREYVCSSEDYICPPCHPKICTLKPLKDLCYYFFFSHLFDNAGTFLLGIVMTFWGTIFLEMWKRKSNLYIMKWNLTSVEHDLKPRTNYEEHTDIWILSPVTGHLEMAMSRSRTFFRFSVAVFTVFLMCFLVFVFVFTSIGIKFWLRLLMMEYVEIEILKERVTIIVMFIGALVQVLLIILIDQVKNILVPLITEFENPRTQLQYDNSFILNFYIVAFINSYSAIFYAAFIKGMFFTNPGDQNMYDLFSFFKLETCHVAGCNMDVIILLAFLLGLKHLCFKCINKTFLPIFKYVVNLRKRKKDHPEGTYKPQWEEDYALQKLNQRTILNEYNEIIIRLGLVLFFTSVFPFAPLLALLCNYVEMRVDAYAYAKYLRRPVPRKVVGIEVWYSIIFFMAHLGVLINALTTFITKEFVYMQYYKISVYYVDLEAFAKQRFSDFAIEDYWDDEIKSKFNFTDKCLYRSVLRNPPGAPDRYQWNQSLFVIWFFILVSIIFYEHVVFLLTQLIAFLIPDISDDVNEQLHYRDTLEKRMVRKNRNRLFFKNKE